MGTSHVVTPVMSHVTCKAKKLQQENLPLCSVYQTSLKLGKIGFSSFSQCLEQVFNIVNDDITLLSGKFSFTRMKSNRGFSIPRLSPSAFPSTLPQQQSLIAITPHIHTRPHVYSCVQGETRKASPRPSQQGRTKVIVQEGESPKFDSINNPSENEVG